MNFKSFLMMVALGVSVVGCVKPPIEGRQDPYGPSQVNFASEDLRRNTATGQAQLGRDPRTGILFVTVPIRAATNLQLYVEYRTKFLDQNGNVIDETGWLSKTLAPNVPDEIRINSTSPLATDFHMDLRYGRLH